MSDTDSSSDTESASDDTSSFEEDDDLDSPDYKNWVRAAKSLEYLQQGLAPFVLKEVTDKINTFLQGLHAPQGQINCTICTDANLLPDHPGGQCISKDQKQCYCSKQKKKRRPCPNGVCSKLYHFIVQEHRLHEPLWKNTDISKWCSDIWYVAKCFMTTKCPANSAQSTDAAGLLSIIINASFFQQKLTCKIDPTNPVNDIFTQARQARNDILHRAEMKFSEQELSGYIDLFVAVLHDYKSLLNDQNAKDGVNKLIHLKNHQIHISNEEKKKILIARKEALRALKIIEEKKVKAIQDIQASKDESIQAIAKRKSEVLEELEDFKTDARVVSNMQQNVDDLSETATNIEDRLKIVEEQLKKLNQPLKRSISKCNKSPSDSTKHSSDEAMAGLSYENNSEDTKIKTDEDVIESVIDEDVSLREYQKELAEEGMKGTNVVVMAPTNTGKTRVACKIMQELLRKKKDGKVIFLVENEALAFQQGKVFSKRLPVYRTKVISGSVLREKKQYLKDFIHTRDILVVTAQVLLNALKTNEIDSLAIFSLIVFDECHHTHDLHRYNEIMGRYMDLKLQGNVAVSPLPQIVGLTASLGVGGHTDPKAAMCHMKKLLANLDATFLCTVKENKMDLQKYVNRAKEHIVTSKKRVDDMYRNAVLENMHAIDQYMITHPSLTELPPMTELTDKCRLPSTAGDVSFQNWLSDFKKALGDVSSERVRRMMVPCWEHLQMYNKSLMIHADARIKDAKAVLVEFMNEHEEKLEDNETDKMLLRLYENLKAQTFDAEPENPKLLKLEELINNTLANNDHTRGIVFVKTRELAKALISWMNETDSLKPLNAKECVGQGVSAEKGGMTRHKQKNVLEFFRGGHHKLIVATSIAEEGLDITKCNLVIRYEHVTNEIVRLQSRGRARAVHSKYYVLTEEGSWIVGKEEKNKMLEQLMNEIVPQLQTDIEKDLVAWKLELTKMQKDNKLAEEKRDKECKAKMTDDEKELQCFKCSKFICMSSDIRRIQGTQHVVIDEAVQKRISWTRNPLPKFKNDPLKYDGSTFCGNSKCQQKLGGVCEYHGIEFPLISISNFRVVDKNRQGKTFKKWKSVNFVVEDFSLEQFDEVVEKRNEVDT
ncbi:antiviral innate immune response receptor RIG-I-like [Mercenaria mercenaria]|uniref:antiviral innate immune response receptor RIG-I-like n=1 Tax=Mercenaria mercenaria TaxID=6596 RepID=UPI00234F2C19|nr:antiviral innate immune response receptor RIG-I-like [Mercenaria mercenaria]